MTLIKSISGIRGTVGGAQAENLTPPDVVKFTTAYARLIAGRNPGKKLTIVVGRDALVGTALFLTWLAHKGMTMTQLRATYPSYFASKNKIELTPAIDVDKVLREIKERYSGENVNDIDGVKIDFAENWVHLRKSNTEPIIRVYTEAKSMAEADALAQRFIGEIKAICNI